MAQKKDYTLIASSYEIPKKKRPGRHKKKLNKKDRVKNFFG